MIVIVINFNWHRNTISYNKSADINKTIKRKLNTELLHAVFDPSNVGTLWLVSVSISTDILESASVGIPGPASVGIHVPEPVGTGAPGPVSVGIPGPVSVDIPDIE